MDTWIRVIVASILDAFLLYCEQNSAVGYNEANRMRQCIRGFVDKVQAGK